jgi:hypothetical protein
VYLPAYEDGTECSETSAYKNSDVGELPRRKHTASKNEIARSGHVTLLVFADVLSKKTFKTSEM